MKGQWSKLFVVTVAFLLIVAGCAAPPPPSTPTPPTATPVPPTPAPLDVVQKYQDAIGRHDVDTAMALFTDDASYAWGDYFTTSDKTMIRNWLEYGVALNAQTTVNNCKLTDPTVTCESRWVNDCFGTGATGGHDIGGAIVFTVKYGKISNFALTEKPVPEYSQWGDAFFKWLEDSYPMEIGSVVQALQTWRFDRDFGQRLGKFCKEYAESLKATPVATSTPFTSTSSGDLEKLAKAYQDALNKRDPDAFLALFADDGFTYTDDTTTYRNKDELRLAIEELTAHGNTLEFDSCETKGSELHCVALNRNDYCIRAVVGLDVARTETIFTAKDGKIGSVKITLLPEDQAAMGQAYPKFEAWLQTNRPDEWEKLGSPGAYDLKGRALGELRKSVCKAYLESLKATPAAAPSSDAEKLAKAFQDALDQRDVDTALALFVDEGLTYFNGGATARNKETLRRDFLEVGSGYGDTVELVDCGPKGEALRCTALWRNDYCLKAWCGLDVYHDELTLKPKDGKIQLMSFQDGDVSAQDQLTCAAMWPKYQTWAEANRPDEWKKLSAPVAYDLKGQPLGELESRVCKAYLEATKQ